MSRKRAHHHHKVRKKGLPPESLVYTGSRTDAPSNVLTLWYSEGEVVEKGHYSPEMRHRNGGVFWADVRSLTDEKFIAQVGSDISIHPLALEDVLDTQQRAKLEEYDNGLFLILPNPRFDAENIEMVNEQIALFVGQNFVVSFQEDPDDTLVNVRNRIHDGIGRIRKKKSDYLAYAITDTIVDNYYIVLDEIESKLLEVEASLHRNGAEPSCKAQIFDLKRVVNEFKHRMLPLRDAVTRFYRTESNIVEDANRLYLRDVVDHVAQIIDNIDNQRDMLASLEALFHAEGAARLNNVMRLLTVISTIFIPLSFIAGVYGMNFDYMPELHSRYGYFIVLGSMFVAMSGMLIYFRVKKWI